MIITGYGGCSSCGTGAIDDLVGAAQKYAAGAEKRVTTKATSAARSGATSETQKFFTTAAWVAAAGVVLYLILRR